MRRGRVHLYLPGGLVFPLHTRVQQLHPVTSPGPASPVLPRVPQALFGTHAPGQEARAHKDDKPTTRLHAIHSQWGNKASAPASASVSSWPSSTHEARGL